MTSIGAKLPNAPEGSFLERLRKMRPAEAEDRRRRRRITENVRSDSPFWNGLMTDANGVDRKVRREIRTDGMKVTVVKEVTCHDHTLDRETYIGKPDAHGERDFPIEADVLTGIDPYRLIDLVPVERWDEVIALLDGGNDSSTT